MSEDLTPVQAAVLEFIARHIVRMQRPPTRGEIAKHFGWSSNNAAEECLQRLAYKGFLAMDGAKGSSHWQRYVRVIRWPKHVLPIICLAADI